MNISTDQMHPNPEQIGADSARCDTKDEDQRNERTTADEEGFDADFTRIHAEIRHLTPEIIIALVNMRRTEIEGRNALA